MPYEVKLTYFKPSGKYYTSGDYVSARELLFEIFEEVGALARGRRLPGLTGGHSPFAVHVEVPMHPNAHPCLIVLDEWEIKA